MTFALPGTDGSYAAEALTKDPFIHQEMIEILYHTLWETVHVFLSTASWATMSVQPDFSILFWARKNRTPGIYWPRWPPPSR